jgi:hypothetical protein
MASSSKGENGAGDVLPAPLDQLTRLSHKLINVVVVAVVYGVDVGKPTVPASPLTIAYPTLSEANHPATIDIQPVAELEVLYLYLMFTCCYAIKDVLMLADEG